MVNVNYSSLIRRICFLSTNPNDEMAGVDPGMLCKALTSVEFKTARSPFKRLKPAELWVFNSLFHEKGSMYVWFIMVNWPTYFYINQPICKSMIIQDPCTVRYYLPTNLSHTNQPLMYRYIILQSHGS